MKRFIRVVLAIALATSALAIAAPAEAAPRCAARWGTQQVYADTTTVGPITGVRTGRHTCYDRLVIDVDGKVDGYEVQYMPKWTKSRSELEHLQIDVGAGMVDAAGHPTFGTGNNIESPDLSRYRTFRSLRGGGGAKNSIFSLDVRARLPFRVFILDGPGGGSRLVVDVAHRR